MLQTSCRICNGVRYVSRIIYDETKEVRRRRVLEREYYTEVIQDGFNRFEYLLYRLHDRDGCKNPFDIGGIAGDGRGVAVEVKRVGGRLVAHQKIWLREFACRGGLAYVVYVGGEDGSIKWVEFK